MSEEEMLWELRKISKVLILANATAVEKELSKLITTDERRKLWALIGEKPSSKDLADAVGISQRGVQKFLKEAKTAGIIDSTDDSIRRVLDYVPPSWIALVSAEEEGENTHRTLKPNETLDNAGNSATTQERN